MRTLHRSFWPGHQRPSAVIGSPLRRGYSAGHRSLCGMLLACLHRDRARKPASWPPLLVLVRVTYREPTCPDDRLPRHLSQQLQPSAPVRWQVEACLAVVDAALNAYVNHARGSRQVARAVPAGLASGLGIQRARRALEHRRARELGLTTETAPQATRDFAGAIVVAVVWDAALRRRGSKPGPRPGPASWLRRSSARPTGGENGAAYSPGRLRDGSLSG